MHTLHVKNEVYSAPIGDTIYRVIITCTVYNVIATLQWYLVAMHIAASAYICSIAINACKAKKISIISYSFYISEYTVKNNMPS